MFDVSVTKHVQFKNYVAKEPVIDNRIFLNGNRLFFLRTNGIIINSSIS